MTKSCLDQAGNPLNVEDIVICVKTLSPKVLIGQQYTIRRITRGTVSRVFLYNILYYDFVSSNFQLYSPGPNSPLYRTTTTIPSLGIPQTVVQRKAQDYPHIDKAADDIIALINRNPRSPTKDEIFQTLTKALGV